MFYGNFTPPFLLSDKLQLSINNSIEIRMTETLFVTVVIVNYNGSELLKRCLSSLTNQTRKPDQIIVVDNNSSDGSADYCFDYPKVELISLKENRGFAAANNLAVKKAKSATHIALLNPDAAAEKEWLENLMNAAAGNPDVACFGSVTINDENENILDGAGDTYHISGLAWRYGYGVPTDKADLRPREIFSACAAAALYQKDAFLKAGGFDERYFCYFEDVDLGYRLRLLGHRMQLVPGAIAKHAGSAITGGKSGFTIYHGHRNLVWTYIKNTPWTLLIRSMPEFLIMNLVSLIYYSLKGQGEIILRAKKDALLGLWGKDGVLADRRKIQQREGGKIANIKNLMVKNPLPPYSSRRRLSLPE